MNFDNRLFQLDGAYKSHRLCWWVPLAVAGAKLVGNVVDAKSTADTNAKKVELQNQQNAFNKQMMEENQAWQEKMWNKQNEYNTASAQRQRLEQAGLNPYLMMNGGSAGTAGSVGSVSTASAAETANIEPVQTDLGSVGESYVDAMQSSSVAQMQKSQKSYYDEQADYVKEITRGQQIQNEFARAKQFWELENMIKSSDNKDLQNEYQGILNRITQLDLEYQEDTQIDRRNKAYYDAMTSFMQAEGQSLDNQIKDTELRYLPARLQGEIRNLSAQYYALVTQGKMNIAAAQKYVAERLVALAKEEGYKIDNSVARALKDFKIDVGIDNLLTDRDIQHTTLLQMRRDYANPFAYIGKALGGSFTLGKVMK